MPSRKIQDCVEALQVAWADASKTFAQLHPDLPQPFLTCTHRTEAEQLELYAQGRTKPGPKVTQLKKGSKHNAYPSLAFDIAFKNKEGKLDWSPKLFKAFADIVANKHPSVEWGGNWSKFKDLPHFQVS